MIDDTGIPKTGAHPVGVARQCGQIGKRGDCQVAVTLSLAADYASLPIAHRLYLPQPQADDTASVLQPACQPTLRSKPSRS